MYDWEVKVNRNIKYSPFYFTAAQMVKSYRHWSGVITRRKTLQQVFICQIKRMKTSGKFGFGLAAGWKLNSCSKYSSKFIFNQNVTRIITKMLKKNKRAVNKPIPHSGTLKWGAETLQGLLCTCTQLRIGVSSDSHLYPRELLMGCSIASFSLIFKEAVCMVLKQCNIR